jgi:ABC-2 type transport system permease protein
LKAGAEQTQEERRLQFTVQKAIVQLTLEGPEQPVKAGSDAMTGPIVVTQASLDVRRRRESYGFQYSVPAYLVMFVFINLLVSGAGIAEERVTGRLRRLVLAPITFRQIVLAKLLSRFATGWVQIAYMLLVGTVILHVSWGANPLLLCAFLSVFALAAGALGLLVGTLFADADKCATFAIWSVMILSPLGGLWWPLDVVGPTLRKVAYFVPTGWAMQAVDGMMAFGAGPLDVAPYAGAFLLVFVASFLLASRRLEAQLVS